MIAVGNVGEHLKDYKEGDKVELYVNALTPMLAGNENAKLVRCPYSVVDDALILDWHRNHTSTVSLEDMMAPIVSDVSLKTITTTHTFISASLKVDQ